MCCNLMIVVVLTILVGALSASDSGSAETELVEAGYELATKAASLYAEESFPGSSLGPGEPVYDITDENSIVGWYYIVDTNGEDCMSFSGYLFYLDELYNKYLTPLLYDKPFEDLNAITKFNNLLKRYKAIYISNYLNYGPSLDIDKGRTITITTIPYQIKQICDQFNTQLTNTFTLCSLPNSTKFAIHFMGTNNSFYSIRNFQPIYFSADEINEVISRLSNSYIANNQFNPVEIWQEIIEYGDLDFNGTLRDDLEWHDWYCYHRLQYDWSYHMDTSDIPFYKEQFDDWCIETAAAMHVGYNHKYHHFDLNLVEGLEGREEYCFFQYFLKDDGSYLISGKPYDYTWYPTSKPLFFEGWSILNCLSSSGFSSDE